MEVKFSMLDLLLVSPAIALLVASLIPITIKVFRGNREQNPFATIIWAFIGLLTSAGLAILTYDVSSSAFSNALVFDGISTLSNLLIIFVTGFTLLYARESLSTCGHQFSEFVFLMLNAAIGMMILAWSNDLIVTFIGIELMSLALYIMIAMSLETKLSKEAAFKYFVLGSFASAIFLYGVSFIFGTAGTTYMNEIAQIAVELISSNRLFLFGVALLVIGLGFKVAIVPFHAWTPDVYEGSPTPVTGFMATGVKIVIFAAFLRFIGTEVLLGEQASSLVVCMQWLAVFTMLVGNIAAIMQNNFKRMLAYSSIAHSGYAFVGVIAAGISGEPILGASGTMFYIFAYTIMTIGAFGVVCLFENREDASIQMSDLKGLASRSPWVALCLTLFMLSLAGIPPTVGFFGKFFIFSGALKQGLYWLVIWGVINSVISVYYYLKPVVYMYMHDEDGARVQKRYQLTHLSIGLTAILVVVTGLAADPFYRYIYKSVSGLF